MSFINDFIEWSHHSLIDNDEAVSYMRGRGVSMDQCKRHRLGYVAGDYSVNPNLDPNHSDDCSERDKKQHWCDSCRYARWSAEWIEVEGQPLKDPVMGRRIVGSVVFPLSNYAGNYVGFQVRKIKEKEYDTFMIKFRPEGHFFGISQSITSIWSTREIWITEGPFDALILERLVAPNVVAITTSSVSKNQIRFIRRFAEVVNSCLDSDIAGRSGFRQLVKWNRGILHIRDIKFPSINSRDKDVGDYWKAVGDVVFSEHFKEQMKEHC